MTGLAEQEKQNICGSRKKKEPTESPEKRALRFFENRKAAKERREECLNFVSNVNFYESNLVMYTKLYSRY